MIALNTLQMKKIKGTFNKPERFKPELPEEFFGGFVMDKNSSANIEVLKQEIKQLKAEIKKLRDALDLLRSDFNTVARRV